MSRKIKDKYLKDEEGAAFMHKHPEMFGWASESTHDRPGNAMWACKEPDIDKVDKAYLIQDALLTYPKGRERTALEMYFAGDDMGMIQAFLKHKLRSSTIKFIWKVKGKVMAHSKVKKRKKLNMKHRKIVSQNTFEKDGVSKKVYLVYTPKSKTHLWTDENYRVLPESVQDYLDAIMVSDKSSLDLYNIFKDAERMY